MKRYRRIWTIILVVGGYVLRKARSSTPVVLPTEKDLITVSTGALQEEIQVLGVIQLVDSQNLQFETNGKIKHIFVEPGMEVKKGDILAELDTRDIDIDIQQQELAIEAAHISYNKLYSSTKEYQIKQVEASAQQYQNQYSLGDQDITSLENEKIQKIHEQEQQIQTLTNSIELNQQKLADLDNEIAYINQQGTDSEQKSLSDYSYQISSAQNTARSTLNDVKDLLAKMNDYFFIDLPNERPGSISAENTSYLRLVNNLYPQVDTAVDSFEEKLHLGSYTDIPNTLQLIQETKDMITKAIELNDAGYDAIDASVTSKSISQTTLDSQSTTLTNFKNKLLSSSASLDQTIKALQSASDPQLTQLGTLTDIGQKEQMRLQLQHAIAQDTLSFESAQSNLHTLATAYDLQIAKKQNDISQSKLNAEVSTLNANTLKAGPSTDEKSSAANQIAQAELRLEQIKNEKEMYQIIAPFDGTVSSIDFDSNDTVSAHLEGITVEIPHLYEIEVKFDQLDIAKIHTGLPTIISFDAYPGRSFTGTIDEIDPNPIDEQGVVLYKAYIKLIASNIQIFNKMDTTVVVALGATTGLVIPSISITSTGGKDFVQKQVGADFINQEVAITLTNGAEALIGSGLQVGDKITTRTFVITNKAPAGGLFGGPPRNGGAGGNVQRSQQAGAR